MKTKLSSIFFLILFLFAGAVTSGCSDSKNKGTTDDTITPGQTVTEKNNWNDMHWDQNNWE